MQVFLIVSNVGVNMVIAQVLNLKAGPISVEGYYLFDNTNKFWCHFGGQAIGVLIAFFYYDSVLPYRQLRSPEEKAEKHPHLHHWI